MAALAGKTVAGRGRPVGEMHDSRLNGVAALLPVRGNWGKAWRRMQARKWPMVVHRGRRNQMREHVYRQWAKAHQPE